MANTKEAFLHGLQTSKIPVIEATAKLSFMNAFWVGDRQSRWV